MSELLLVNPRRRKRRKSRKTSASGRRNPRPMSAKQRAYFGPRKSRRRRSRRASVTGRRNPVAAFAPRRRRSGRARSSRKFQLLPANFIKGTALPAAIGGAGALAVDIAWGMAPFIPASVKTGPLAPIAKLGGALLVGALASMVGGRSLGDKVVAGYITVATYTLAKGVVSTALPSLTMGDYMGYVQNGVYMPDGSVGAYLTDPGASMPGATNPLGAYVGDYDGGYGN